METDASDKVQAQRFFRIAVGFACGLLALALATDWIAGWYVRHTGGRFLVGKEVYQVKTILEREDPAVGSVYLGDSVARQLFPPGAEASSSVKYLTSNQAITMAGQYYLLEESLQCFPNLKEVVLFYTTWSWRNNLHPIFTRDYFCGYFHTAAQVRDVFLLTHDFSLLSAHLPRALLPNLMAINSALSVEPTPPPLPASMAALMSTSGDVTLSPVSEHYLTRMHHLCESKHITLRVYSGPTSAECNFRDSRCVYDAPILYLSRTNFLPDKLHLTQASLADARATAQIAFQLGQPYSSLSLHRHGSH